MISVRAAREYVAGVVAAAHYRGDADIVALLVSEVVTNAIRHAATPFDLAVDAGQSAVTVTVTDGAGGTPPTVRSPLPEDTSGRGMLIVERLATDWGTTAAAKGRKAVWFTLSAG